MPHVNRSGVNIYYETYGQGVPLVFLHPFSTNGYIWYFQTFSFARTNQCVVIDERGHGRSDKPPQGYAITEMAADVMAVLDEHRPEYNMAHELAEHSLREAQRKQDPSQLMWGHYFLGETLRFLGQSALACVHLEKALTLYDPAQHRALAVRAGGDAGTDSLSELALARWSLG